MSGAAAGARRSAAFDMKAAYFDLYCSGGHEPGVGFRRIETLPERLYGPDIVGRHVPSSDATRDPQTTSPL